MAKEEEMPKALAMIHRKKKTPLPANVFNVRIVLIVGFIKNVFMVLSNVFFLLCPLHCLF